MHFFFSTHRTHKMKKNNMHLYHSLSLVSVWKTNHDRYRTTFLLGRTLNLFLHLFNLTTGQQSEKNIVIFALLKYGSKGLIANYNHTKRG